MLNSGEVEYLLPASWGAYFAELPIDESTTRLDASSEEPLQEATLSADADSFVVVQAVQDSWKDLSMGMIVAGRSDKELTDLLTQLVPAGLSAVRTLYGMPAHHTLESLCKEAAVAPEHPRPWITHFAGFALRSQTRGPLPSAEQVIQKTLDANATAFPQPSAGDRSKANSSPVVEAQLLSRQSSTLVPSMKMVPSSLKDEARKLARQSSNL
eukprot:758785-Prymnesium_polylepis.1